MCVKISLGPLIQNMIYCRQGVFWKELAFFDGFCLVALSYFGGGELAFVSYFTWLARLASLFGRY